MSRVVIGDDDPFARRTASDLLQKWGYDVVAVGDGREAYLTIERESGPVLALLNFRLPQMDGVEVCRRLRERKSAKQHLILVGNAATRDEVMKSTEAMADDFIIKPFNPQELRIRVGLG